jgi:hypothetical protein
MANANNPNRNMPIYMDRMPDHAYQRATEPAITQPPQMLQQQQLQQQSQGQLPHPQTLQQPPPQQQEQFQQPQFNWDEINWNNIVGDVALQPNPELPEFDWVSFCANCFGLVCVLNLIGLLGRSSQFQRPEQCAVLYRRGRLRSVQPCPRSDARCSEYAAEVDELAILIGSEWVGELNTDMTVASDRAAVSCQKQYAKLRC